jgi:hypothetical protein
VEVTWLEELISAPVSASVPPPLGKVHVDEDEMANVGLYAPVKVRFPLSVVVNDPLFMPVPPYVPVIIEPFHTPLVMVPIADTGRSALVKLIGPKVEPLLVPITWCAAWPVVAPSVNVEPEIVQANQFAPAAEQEVAPPSGLGVCVI